MIREAIDRNIVISAFLNISGTPAKVLKMAYDGKFIMLADERIVEEYRRVLSYQEFETEKKEAESFVNFVLHNAELCGACEMLKGVKVPEDDLKFIEVADKLKADFIVTGNTRHFNFTEYAGCRIISPAEFITLHE